MGQQGKGTSMRRTDASGRAFAGSQRWLQYYVNDQPDVLSSVILREAGIESAVKRVQWKSPLRAERFTEYRDAEFLKALGCSSLLNSLREFWPNRGPVWDALAQVQFSTDDPHGVLLVEAKSYPEEAFTEGCKAGEDSLKKIELALAGTRAWLGARRTEHWLGPLYQSANRLAHLYFLREISRQQAWMVNVYFLNDRRSPTTLEMWKQHISSSCVSLGLPATGIPYVLNVFLEAKERL